MIPNVTVNVSENAYTSTNTTSKFIPAVIMKTTSGPVGELVEVTNANQFVNIFGQPNETVPTAYAVKSYLQRYQPIYVCRVQGEGASIAEGKISSSDEEPIGLISFGTNYTTDDLNDTVVKLEYNKSTNKLSLSFSLYGQIYSTNKFSYREGSTADVLSTVLEDIVSQMNALQTAVTFKNLFAGKTESDPIPKEFTVLVGQFKGGNKGSDTIDNDKVISCLDLFESPELEVDVIMAPEFANPEVITKIVELADKRHYLCIASPNITVSESDTPVTAAQKAITAIESWPNSKSLAVYYPDVRYTGFNKNIPASIAVLDAYAKADGTAKWYAPAGVARGTLVAATSIVTKTTDEVIELLYENSIPVNSIKDISGTGLVVWGQKTTGTSSQYSDRINISRLVKSLTREIYRISYDYLFEPITDALFSNWKLRVSNRLDEVVQYNGITEYYVKMDNDNNTDETIARNELHGFVAIKPLECAEFITIDFTVTNNVEQQ